MIQAIVFTAFLPVLGRPSANRRPHTADSTQQVAGDSSSLQGDFRPVDTTCSVSLRLAQNVDDAVRDDRRTAALRG